MKIDKERKANKSKVSCEKYFSPDDFYKYFIDSVIVLKQISANNSLDNAPTLLRNNSYVDANFKWQINYCHY